MSPTDLGQVILGFLIAITGYLIKQELMTIKERLDKHDNLILGVVDTLGEIRGRLGYDNIKGRGSILGKD